MNSNVLKSNMILKIALSVAVILSFMFPLEAISSCGSPANPIEAENCLTGNPSSEWDITGAGDATIQGFATDISVNKGETVHFKIKTDASSYQLNIYRIGYYAGNGARLVTTVTPTVTLPQTQPACSEDTAAKLTDCGNWSESVSWTVPAGAVSGVYIAKLVRTDTGGASHIIFIVRDDTGGSDLLFKTSDTTWQAYNSYGLGYIEYPDYGPYPSQKATKSSYNRPFTTRAVNSGMGAYNWFFQAEYPMIRWLESNGYNVSYFTSVDADRRGAELLEHKVFLSVGHDEYWSFQERTNVEAARTAGKHLAFFSGNTSYRKIRWENSIDGSNTFYRTMVSYSESNSPTHNDPAYPIWTGTWRDYRFSPPADGGRPENALTGTLFTVSDGPNELGISLEVPEANGKMRFWRNTPVASLSPGQTATVGDRVVGYEFDEDIDNGYRPNGSMQLSSTPTPVNAKLLGNNINLGQDSYLPGTATHVMTLYRASTALVFSAGTVQWSWGLDGQHDNGPSTTDLSMKQATVNLFADMGNVQPATIQAGLTAASTSADITPPSSAISSPSAGSSAVTGSTVMITGTAADSGGGIITGVEVSTDNGVTWHPAMGRASWSYTWIPTIQGSAIIRSRAIDDSGNIETPLTGVSVTVNACTTDCTIWPGTVPGIVDAGWDNALELGVKFRSDSVGYITGIRFYKSSANIGTHVANLWSGTGTLLASAPFHSETASGWQQVNFLTPVSIAANTDYVASYFVSDGHYSADPYYFLSEGIDSAPLHALKDGISGLNGVYAYGAASSFPNQGFHSNNYWVDVVYNATSPPVPTLTTIEVTPASQTIFRGETQQFTATGIYSNGSTTNLTSQVTWGSSNTGVATITSAGLATAVSAGGTTISAIFGLTGSTTLTVHVMPLTITTQSLPGGLPNVSYSAALSASGGTLPFTWTISSGSLPTGLSLDSGTGAISGTPTVSGIFNVTIQVSDNASQTTTKALSIVINLSGSILIISSSSNPFSSYYAEILRAEGLTEFTEKDITSVSSTVLASYDVVILGDMALTSGQVTMLSDWVSAGGNLIAMRPDKQLAGMLGLTDLSSTRSNAYLLVNTASGPGVGIVDQTIQYHGTADLYSLSGASNLATLFSDATTTTSSPAVTLRSVGSGQAAAFTYDLARSVVYTRQGNPAWAAQERDGFSPIRPDDLFYGAKAGDIQPDWVDLNKVAIPQADEQQRLLANLIIQMSFSKKPLPRFWYLPRNLKAAVVMSGDDHNGNGTAGRFDDQLAINPGCSVDNWECIRSTSYIYPDNAMTNAQAAAYDALGFEIGTHISSNCADWTPVTLESFFADQLSAWAITYSSLPPPVTSRMHCIVWSDYATMPAVELNHGIRLDTNYYYWPPGWVQDRPGFFTGSGIPMRFTDANGNLINVYQATTQLTDESGQTYTNTIDQLLSKATGTEGYYGVFTVNAHTDTVVSSLSGTVVSSAMAYSIPVVSSRQMLTWLDGRNDSRFDLLGWSGNNLSFTISVGQGATGLVAMVPVPDGRTVTSMTHNGSPFASYDLTRIKGIQYARFTAANGNYTVAWTKADQATLTVVVTPSTVVYGSTAALSSSGGSGTGAVTYSVGGSTGCSVAGTTLSVTNVSGTCSVTATKAADTNYNSASSSPVTVTLQKANQTITFGPLPILAVGGPNYPPGGTASSGLTVGYASSNSAVATIVGGNIHIVSAGTTTITASQAGNTNYNAATPVAQGLMVALNIQTITVTQHAAASAAYNSTFPVAATASSTLPVAITTSGGCSGSGSGSATILMTSGTTTCTVNYNQAGSVDFGAAQLTENTTAQKINQAALTAVVTPATVAYGSTAALSTSGGSGTGAVTYSAGASTGCSVAGSILSATSVSGTCSVTATKAADTNYNAATSSAATVTLYMGGDLNGDNVVDIADALKALRIAAGLDVPTASDIAHGDVAPLVNGIRTPDGKIDLSDVVAILRKVVGLPSW